MLFHAIPNPMPDGGGPTLVINGNTGSILHLGKYNATEERMDLLMNTPVYQQQNPGETQVPVTAMLDHGVVFDWAAAGNAVNGRLMIVGKLDCTRQCPSRAHPASCRLCESCA